MQILQDEEQPASCGHVPQKAYQGFEEAYPFLLRADRGRDVKLWPLLQDLRDQPGHLGQDPGGEALQF